MQRHILQYHITEEILQNNTKLIVDPDSALLVMYNSVLRSDQIECIVVTYGFIEVILVFLLSQSR